MPFLPRVKFPKTPSVSLEAANDALAASTSSYGKEEVTDTNPETCAPDTTASAAIGVPASETPTSDSKETLSNKLNITIAGNNPLDLSNAIQAAGQAVEKALDLSTASVPNFLKSSAIQGIKDSPLGKVITNFNKLKSKADEAFNQAILNISGYAIDDIIRDLDENTIEILRKNLGVNEIQRDLKVNSLKALLNNKMQDAIDIIAKENILNTLNSNDITQEIQDQVNGLVTAEKYQEAFQVLLDLNLEVYIGLFSFEELEENLEKVETDAMELIGERKVPSEARQLVSGISTWKGKLTKLAGRNRARQSQPNAGNTTGAVKTEDSPNIGNPDDAYAFDFVDTAEEFEADVASSTRDIFYAVWWTAATPLTENGSSEVVHNANNRGGEDGNQYHYIILKNGRVQRGRPVAAKGRTENGIDILYIANPSGQHTPQQDDSYKKMCEALYRILPGIEMAAAGERLTDTEGSF